MLRPSIAGLALLTTLATVACGGSGKLKRFDTPQANLTLPTGNVVPPKADVDGVLTAGLSSDATTTQLVKASANSPIANTTLAFPAGSLSIPIDVTVKAGSEAFSADLASELGLEGDTAVTGGGVPVQIDASAVVTLSSPFVLSIDVPAGAGLVDTNQDNLALIYQVKNEGEGRLDSGVVPRQLLSVKNGQVIYSSYFFGWFRLVYLKTTLTETKTVANSQAKAHKGLMLIQSTTQLPSCGATDVGTTVYVKDTGKFKTCTTTDWQDIDLTGPKGDAGATGAAGSTGAAGAAGSNASNFVMKDAAGKQVGLLMGFMTMTNYPNDHYSVISLSDGTYFGVSFSGSFTGVCATGLCTGSLYDSSNATYVNPGCYYKTSTCAGPCYVGHITKNSLALGPNGTIFRASSTDFSTTSYVVASSYYDTQSSQCRTSMAFTFPAASPPLAAYNWPSGVPSPPFTGPMTIEKN